VKTSSLASHLVGWCSFAGGSISRSSFVDTNSSVQRFLCQLQHDAQVLGVAFLRVVHQVWSSFVTDKWFSLSVL